MRHRNANRKLSRNTSHRRSLLRNLVTDLLDHGRLMTTLPKAKEVRPLAEKMITLGKRDNLHARRQLQSYLLRDAVAKKVFDTIAPRFSDRKGGYSRIIKLGNRQGDGADLAIIELLGSARQQQAIVAEVLHRELRERGWTLVPRPEADVPRARPEDLRPHRGPAECLCRPRRSRPDRDRCAPQAPAQAALSIALHSTSKGHFKCVH